jgi:IS5 family transposase
MHEKMPKASKKRASKTEYQSPKQLVMVGFETPFSQKLNPTNRWVQLAGQIPWDNIVNIYTRQLNNHKTGASNVNGRVIIGSLIIKHLCNLSDEETILQIQENMYMQYFLGYSSFSSEAPFDASLFVEIRKRLGVDQLKSINEKIYNLYMGKNEKTDFDDSSDDGEKASNSLSEKVPDEDAKREGRLLVDATACPQDIQYPTDLNLLSDSRVKTEELIDCLYDSELHGSLKPRTYREVARKEYLVIAQKRKKSHRVIHKGVGQQLRFVRRNLKTIEKLLKKYASLPFSVRQKEYYDTIKTVYAQQLKMYRSGTHSVEDRIVSIHQPHVRPIVRGKDKGNTEFGSKLNLSLVNGYSFIDHLKWDAYNEGVLLKESILLYYRRHGYWPKEVMADRIYCNQENRRLLKEWKIRLLAKPLGRPPAVKLEHVSPGERNPIEGKFGQAKTRYGMDRIKARLKGTSESWIASIVLVLNLVKLAGRASYSLIEKWLEVALQFLGLFQNRLLFQ